MEVTAKGRPKLMKSKSAAPNNLFKNVEFTIHPDTKEPVGFKPKAGGGAAQVNGYHEDQVIVDEGEDRTKGRHDRSNSFGKYKRLEARPLRRSSIASVRRSDRTVREKGKGYTFDDDIGGGDTKKQGLPPIKMPLRDQAGRTIDAERPSTPGASPAAPKSVAVDINMEEAFPNDRKKKETDERQRVVDAVKTAAAGKSWLKKQDAQEGMVQKLGTIERKKVKQRRAMYPPLSTFINPEDKDTKDALEEISQRANGKQNLRLKVVDIAIDDDAPAPSNEKKSAIQTKTGPKTVSVPTANETTSSSRSPTSPTSPTSPSHYKPKVITGGLVASRTARLVNLMANDFRPPKVKDKLAEKEELKKPSPVETEPGEKHVKEEESAPTSSPSAQRRSLPRVPAEEPFHSTKETTKIVKRKQTGKSKFHFGKGKKGGKKGAEDMEDMGFVVLDFQDGLSTPERGTCSALLHDKNLGIFDSSIRSKIWEEIAPWDL